jgi:hypothetical protein
MKTSLVDNRTWLQVDGKWHRLDCIEQIFKWKKDHDRYVSKYPNHCRVCNGSGVHVSSENAAPHGSGHYWPMRTDSECDACIGKNTCPMCGKQHGKDWKADECECGCELSHLCRMEQDTAKWLFQEFLPAIERS